MKWDKAQQQMLKKLQWMFPNDNDNNKIIILINLFSNY